MHERLLKPIIILSILILGLSCQCLAQITEESYSKNLSKAVKRLDSLALSYESSQIDSAEVFYQLAIELAEKENNFFYVAKTLNKLGFNYIYIKKDQTKAIEIINKALVVAKKNNDFINLAEGYKLLAVISFDQKIANSIELIDKAIDYAKQSKAWWIEKDCYDIKSGQLVSLKEFKRAEEAFLLLLKLCKKHDFDSWFSSSLFFAEFLESQKRHEQAREIYKELELNKNQLNNSKGNFVYMNDLGVLATKLKNYEEAERIFSKALDYEIKQTKVDTFHLSFIFRNLTGLYEKKGDFKSALTFNKKWTEATIWLMQKRQTQDSQVKMTQLKSSLDLEKKELAINLLKTQKDQQLLLLIGSAILVLVLSISIFQILKNRQKLETQRKELSALNNTKDKLFTILSHDLRSPVANLENNIMLMNWGAFTKEEFIESVASLGLKIQQVRAMLENMLYWSTSQMGGIKPATKPLNLYSIVNEQIEQSIANASRKNIQVLNEVPKDSEVKCDENHLKIILSNLIQNAIKFTPTKGKIEVSFINVDATYQLQIKDNGIGISDLEISNLFKFGMNNSKVGTKMEAGTGVGLVLVKELVDLNNLKIAVNSEIGKGSTFNIIF